MNGRCGMCVEFKDIEVSSMSTVELQCYTQRFLCCDQGLFRCKLLFGQGTHDDTNTLRSRQNFMFQKMRKEKTIQSIKNHTKG